MPRQPKTEEAIVLKPTPEAASPGSTVSSSQSPPNLSPFRTPEISGFLQELENLLTQCRVALLFGAGCSKCAGLPLMDELTAIVQISLSPQSLGVLTAVVNGFTGAPRCTIEDFMSEIVDLVAIAERRKLRSASSPGVIIDGKTFTSEALGLALDDVKREIAKAISSPFNTHSIEVHRTFIRTLHGTLRSGRSSTFPHAIDYFTLNYDTLIEDALSLERIPTADGFQGGATGWWEVEQYDDSSASARVY